MMIADREIGPGSPPWIVAEMSGNHNQSFARAMAIVEAAAAAGAHAMKFQTYTADTMTLDLQEREFFIDDPDSPWHGQSMHELYRKAHTPWEWHRPLFERCRQLGMIPFSSAFDASAVDFLEELGVPCHKIASPEIVDLPLVRKAASTGKPLLVSTGMATEDEIGEMLATARQAGCSQVVLLKCTTAYPANCADANLRTIPHLHERFGVPVGLSDHTPGIGVAIASIAFGSCVIEKHFTLARQDGGVDAAFSMEPAELRQLVEESTRTWKAMGRVQTGPVPAEIKSLRGRRSLYVSADMNPGEPFTYENIRSIRPGFGLPPKCLEAILGKRAARPISRGTPLAWDMVAGNPDPSPATADC